MKIASFNIRWTRGLSISALLAATAGILAGCNGMGSTTNATAPTTDPPASARQHTLLENIPLPIGFRLVPERSVASKAGQWRVAQCEFAGDTHPDAIARFYVHHMPSARFTLRKQRFDSGEYQLRFESEREECNVRVRRETGDTRLVIDIAPLPKGSAEPRTNRPATRR